MLGTDVAAGGGILERCCAGNQGTTMPSVTDAREIDEQVTNECCTAREWMQRVGTRTSPHSPGSRNPSSQHEGMHGRILYCCTPQQSATHLFSHTPETFQKFQRAL